MDREPVAENDLRDELDASTANGVANVSSFVEPSTLNRGPHTVATIAREVVQASPRGRVDAVSFDDETQARRVDAGLLDKMRRDALLQDAHAHARAAQGAPASSATGGLQPLPPPAPPAVDLAVDYASLPSLEVRRPYDSYEAAFEEHDPVTQLGRAHESAPVARARREEPSYREPSYQEREPESYREPSYKEASYKEPSYQEPSYQARPAASSYEDSRAPASYYPGAAPSFPSSAMDGNHAQNDQESWARREESGPRERPSPPAPSYEDINDSAQWSRDQGAQPPTGWSSLPPVNKTAQGIGPSQQALIDRERDRIEAAMSPHIPPSPRVPHEMRPAFVVGVQPIRNPTPEAWPPRGRVQTPAPGLPSPQQAIHASMNPQAGYAQPQAGYAQPQAGYAQPQGQQPYYTPPQQAPQQAYAQQQYSSSPPHAQMNPRQHMATPGAMNHPVGAQLTQAPAAAPKIGRFAWFVAGAAFGITFAFFATGFFSGTKPTDFPAAAPLPTLTTPAATAPAANAPPATQGALAATPASPVALAPTAPAVAPVAPAAQIAPVAVPTAPAAVSPAAVAPAAPKPAARRAAPPPRRPSAPASQGPKNLGGGGPGADDERPAPAPSGGGSDIGDLLGAGLKP